jgi:serine phosphatase RsbU (regulator of sigma subunit)
MGNPSFRGWSDWLWYTREQPSGQPHLRVQQVRVYVRDQDRSLRFFVEKLGFELALDYSFPNGDRYVQVAPPDGSAFLALVKPPKDSEESLRIGKNTGIVFITEDIGALFKKWSAHAVRFHEPPARASWGGAVYTTFEDVDGNRFNLVEFDRMAEADRRAEHEMAIAKEVQSKLFPQRQPQLKTLTYAGACIQARAVGGDYYDYLDLGKGRLGLVVGDVAGKGIAAALLMANLQANLRSHYAMALDDLGSLLKSVNRLFHENTPLESYATLVFAEYQDESRRMRYVNCGHLAPLLLRGDRTVESLGANCTVLGMFEDWESSTAEVQLEPGDSLVFYTDGVPDALSDDGEEFGEHRLVELLRANGHLDAPALLRTLTESVQAFSGREQEDDITMVVARCRDGT